MKHINAIVMAGCFLFIGCSTSPSPPTHQSINSDLTPNAPLPRSESFFGMHFDLHPGVGDLALGADTSEENIGALLDRVRPDYVQYDCKGHSGWAGYPTALGNAAPHIEKDALEIWRKATRERGVGLFIHFSGVFDMRAAAAHPEWARVDAAGQADKEIMSVFGPYRENMLVPQLDEAVGRYGLDGVWVDGECWAAKMDWSQDAFKAWQSQKFFSDASDSPDSSDAKTNEQPKTQSPPRAPGDDGWQEWKMFQRRAFERYVENWVDDLHAARPDAQATSNWIYTSLFPFPPRADVVDFISGDYQSLDSADRARYEARYLAATAPQAGLSWDLMAWGFAIPGGHMKTAAALKQEASIVLMQGGGFQLYYQPTRRGYVAPQLIETAGEVADFCRARQSFSHKGESVPQVALLFPESTYWAREDEVAPTFGQFAALEGALHALLELHYSVDVLPEFELERRLGEYSLIVIPEAEQLPETLRDKLSDYTSNGGSLLLIGAASAGMFKTELGVEFLGDPGDAAETTCESSSGLALIESGPWQRLAPGGSAQVLAWRHASNDTRKDEVPASIVAPHGRGKIATIPGPAATAYHGKHHPATRALIGDAARAIIPEPMVELDGPPTVDLALRRTADGRLALHLLNLTNAQRGERYVAPDFIPPVGPMTARLRLPEKPKRVTWMPEGEPLDWTWRDGIATVTIPRLEIHGAVVIE